ncbi:MAG: tripartite tricarboxylate transporter substrate binding protein [Casimicrobiaceae bacterium]
MLLRFPAIRLALSKAAMLLAILLGTSCALPAVAVAQAAPVPYPAKPIRMIVPFPPGAGTDTVARLVAQRLGEAMNATIVVDNRTGASGAIGAAEAAKAAPDGYTLLFVASPFTTVAAATAHPGYDPIRQFTPVAPIAMGPLAFVVSAALPVRSMREFIAFARSHPGTLNYGSAGTGSINHLALELLKSRTGIDVVHVPYKGIAPATLDLLSGQIQAMTASIPATLPYLAQHKLKVLAVTGPKRAALLPDVPTWAEAGVSDASVINYWGIVAPADTPEGIVATLNAALRQLLGRPDMRARLEKEGAEVTSGPPADLGGWIHADLDRWRKLIADAHLALE